MKIMTTMTDDVINRYNAMMWNNGEEPYTVSCYGDNLQELLGPNGDNFVASGTPLDADYLINDCCWQIEKHETMLDEDEAGCCHKWYTEDGCRDKRTMAGMKIWRKERKRIGAWKRQFAAWKKFAAANVCAPREIDIDRIDIKFKHGKAVAA